jgi:ABC-type polysaccharide/polyol phosphate transport system ATPase subunit
MKAIKPNSGTVAVTGSIIKLIPGMGFNPNLTARENVKLNSVLMGKSIKEANAIMDEIIEFAELTEAQNDKLKSYSNGMRARLAFSSAIHVRPDVLIMDEFFGGGGDERFKQKASRAFDDILLNGKTIIHTSHNLQTIESYCDQVMVLDKGSQVFCGDPKEAVSHYRNLVMSE